MPESPTPPFLSSPPLGWTWVRGSQGSGETHKDHELRTERECKGKERAQTDPEGRCPLQDSVNRVKVSGCLPHHRCPPLLRMRI